MDRDAGPQQSRRLSDAEGVDDEEHDFEVDPEHWQPYQSRWFWERVFPRDVWFYVGYAVLSGLYVAWSPPAADVERSQGRFVGPTARSVASVLCALFAVFALYVDVARGTPPRRGDRKWKLLGRGVGGHFSFLTVHIITLQACYWVVCALTELAWIHVLDETPAIRRTLAKAVTATYAFSVFSSTLGTVLTLLFLKFNWYEPAWRRDVLEMYLRRGNRAFVRKILVTHIPQLPIAVLDLVVLKQTHGILEAVTPSLWTLLVGSAVYASAYLAFTHLNFRLNGGVYPYPFLDKVLATWSSELTFFAVLTLFVFGVCAAYHFLAVEAGWVEALVSGE